MDKKLLLRTGAVIAAIGVFYSGLMFLELVPADLSIRFWDRGPMALNAAAVLDIACGSVMSYLVVNILLGTDVKRRARNAAIVSVLSILSDWIGGLYGMSAIIGLIASYLIGREA